jgi:hypothetical protein
MGRSKDTYIDNDWDNISKPKNNLVVIESPYAGSPTEIKENIVYAINCMRDCIRRGEVPFASHLLYPQVLDDRNPPAREFGINAGYAFGNNASKVVFYINKGYSEGMIDAKEYWTKKGKKIEERLL